MKTTLETELKFDADPGAQLPPLDFPVTDETEIVLRAVYWDTSDKRLMRWGASLRYRTASDLSEDGWTLKIGAQSKDVVNAVSRDELTAEGSSNAPPRELVDAITAFTLGEQLQPQATITTRRHVRRLGTDIGTPAVEVADDLVRSTLFGQDGPSFRQVEVELLDSDAGETLRAVGERLVDHGLSTSAHGSKIEQVLGGPVDNPFAAEPLGKKSTVADLVPAVIAAGTRRLVAADPLVRVTDEPEAVHEARKATRDLRSQLKALRPLLDRDRVQEIRAELRWIGQLLGDLRDIHVLIHAFDDELDHLGIAEDPAADPIRERLADQEAFRRDILDSALSGDRYLGLLRDLEDLIADPPFRDDVALDATGRTFVRRRGRASWKRSTKQEHRIASPAGPTELHELRKAVKQSRATAQVAERVSLDSARFTRRTGDVKDVLGDHHDTIVWMEWLETEHVRFGSDTAFLAGRLHASADERRRRDESTWTRTWGKAASNRSTAWMD